RQAVLRAPRPRHAGDAARARRPPGPAPGDPALAAVPGTHRAASGVGALLPRRGGDALLEERASAPVEARGLKRAAEPPGAAPRSLTNNLHRTTYGEDLMEHRA